ncbi:hypothetical protein Csa_007037 [Cucumis sativus]|nr:hypothetical protein Csa_007037 [Cucumis sativus]
MDPSTSSTANNENTKKRSVSSEEEAQEVQNGSKRICPDSSPLPTSFGVLTSRCSEVIWKEHGPQILLQVLKEMEKKQTFAGLYSLPTSPSCYGPDSTPLELAIGVVVNRFIVKEGPTLEHESRQQVSKELNEIAYNQTSSTNIKGRRLANERRRGKKAHAARHWRSRSNQHEGGPGSGTWKLRLRFCNKIANVMYHKDKIKAIDEEPLKFEICDAYHNTIIPTGLLLSAPVQFFLFQQQNDSKTLPTLVSADKLIELMSFNVLQQHRLENGIGYVKDLIVNPHSYWISKKFFLVVKVVDEQILMKTGATIEDAISEPFTVKTKRMKGLKKHNPPTKESEVWWLVGISKRGVYHRILSEDQGITNVGDFLRRYHEMGSQALKKILGEKMSIELWKKIVEHAKQCVGYDPTHYRQILQANDCHADSNHNSEVHNSQNQSVETNHFGEAEVEANDSNQNFKTHQQNQNLHEVKDPSSSSTANGNRKKRSVSSEEEADQDGSKRRCPNSSPLPTAGSAHESSKARDLIQELYESFIIGKVKELKRMMAHSINNSQSGEDEARAKEIVDALIKEKRAEWESEFRQLLMNEFDGIANAQLKPLPSTPRSGLAVKSSKYWKSNDFVLGVKVIDEQILEKIGTIEEACSGPFRVLHKRSKGNKKHFPPTKGCEIWRLVGVRKNGVYHRILSSEELGIETVGVFLWKYHEMSSPTLEEFLKRSMSKLDEWDDIVKHAKTCVGYDPADYDQTDHNNNNLMGAGLQVNNHQSQIVENNNDNLVGTEQLANANESLGVLNDQNQSVVQVNFDQNLVVANYYQNESFDQDSQVGQNELPRIDSPDQQWFCDNINLDLDSPSNHWATQMILDSPDPYGIDYRVEQSPEL